MSSKTGLFVDGSKLRNRFGAELRLRVVEALVGGNVANFGYKKFLQQIQHDLGANAVSPLFQGQTGAVSEVKKFCDAALELNMVVGVNADEQKNGRAFLKAPDMVALLNAYPHIYLVCEVETSTGTGADESAPDSVWVAAETAKIKDLRSAGLTAPIKSGTLLGGRLVKFPLRAGAQVLASDPLKNVLFTWQAYWPGATGGGQFYAEANSEFTSTGTGANTVQLQGVDATKAALTACSQSGLFFLPGFDFRDDVGPTGEADLIDHSDSLGMSHAHWVAAGDDTFPDNNLYDTSLNPNSATSTAAMVGGKWIASRARFPDATSL